MPKDYEESYATTSQDFVTDIISLFQQTQTEVSERNAAIQERDNLIYGEGISNQLDIPFGHDITEVNWLRRTVEIHKNMFMSRGFMVSSSYDSKDISNLEDEEDLGRAEAENDRAKAFAQARKQTVEAIIRDNGGNALWSMLAESGGAAGDSAVKCYYDEKNKKYVISPIETIENLYVIWDRDDFRKVRAVAYIYQIPRNKAVKLYGIADNAPTSNLGDPLNFNYTDVAPKSSGQRQMVTVIEATGVFDGWGAEKGQCKEVRPGNENELNCTIVANKLVKVIDDDKKIPKYYIFPNKRQRRRPWGLSDVTDAAIQLNLTYIETLSDWRTVAAKVNFPKFKALGFGRDQQLPKPETRQIQYLPLAEEQDIQPLQQGDANQIDFRAQMDELKEQFVRETGISRVLFDDPSVTFNSNQALLTSLKPTSDIAENKKQLWEPILIDLFTDALETLAAYHPDVYNDLVGKEEDWGLKIIWPSILQKEDPTYQTMILNRFNAGLMSVGSYMEAQGDSGEEIERMKDELRDPVTAAILGKQLPMAAQAVVNAGTAELQAWYQASLPQPADNGQPGVGNTPGVNPNGGAAITTPVAGPVEGGAGLNPVSQPGSGATATSPAGLVAQTAQTGGA